MKTVLVILAMACVIILVGCSSLPTMRYCEHVEYERAGNKIKIKAECLAPIGTSLPGM